MHNVVVDAEWTPERRVFLVDCYGHRGHVVLGVRSHLDRLFD
ncbi:MAG: hypothetical protein NTV35_00050 [Chloroflexi bacterium]|nr:hypothetical protein [Chloroflexota bacterium]